MSYDEQPDAPLHGECAEEIARLERELAKEKARAEKFKWQVRDTCARSEKAESALAEAKRDAERYQWLKSESPAKDMGYDFKDCRITIEFKWPPNIFDKDTLDAAIDAARKAGT
jgi:hypothetical protein